MPHTGSVTVQVDVSRCMGSGRCLADAPELFALDDDNRAYVLAPATPMTQDAAWDLADGCPGGAIEVLIDGVVQA